MYGTVLPVISSCKVNHRLDFKAPKILRTSSTRQTLIVRSWEPEYIKPDPPHRKHVTLCV